MTDKSLIPKQKNTEDLLLDTITALIEGVTGLGSADRTQWFTSAGHILQRFRSGKLLHQLRKEWQEYRAKGRIKDDYSASEQNEDCLQELFASLDDDLPDSQRFEVLKRIFLVAASESEGNRESILPQQFMAMARRLKSGEIAVLLTTHKLAKEKVGIPNANAPHAGATAWLEKIAEVSGLKYTELVAQYESGLIEKGFLTNRTYSDKSGVNLGENFRLTKFGKEFCDFIAAYDRLNAAE